MNKLKLHIKSLVVILKREGISLLEKLCIKKVLRKILVEKKVVKLPIHNIKDYSVDNKKVMLVLPNIPWGFRKQRPQQIFSRLGKKGFTVFYCNPITSSDGIYEISEGVYEVSVSSREHRNILREFDFTNDFVEEFVSSLKNVLGWYMGKECSVFVLHPVWNKFVEKMEYGKLYYDMMDLYAGFPDAREDLIKSEEELVSGSDMVITTADSLYEYAKGLSQNVHIIKNGCDFDMFSNPKRNGLLDCLCGKPVVGYYGALNDWVDVDLLDYVIHGNRDKYFVFIGAINSSKFRKLYKYSNVFFLGEVDNSDLPGYLAYFDVCTIPFVLNDLIKNTNPVKFYEYIASGKAVVSVRLPELEIYEDICYLSNSKEEFSMNVCNALSKESKGLVEKRKKVAKENSWDNRVKDLTKILR